MVGRSYSFCILVLFANAFLWSKSLDNCLLLVAWSLHHDVLRFLLVLFFFSSSSLYPRLHILSWDSGGSRPHSSGHSPWESSEAANRSDLALSSTPPLHPPSCFLLLHFSVRNFPFDNLNPKKIIKKKKRKKSAHLKFHKISSAKSIRKPSLNWEQRIHYTERILSFCSTSSSQIFRLPKINFNF